MPAQAQMKLPLGKPLSMNDVTYGHESLFAIPREELETVILPHWREVGIHQERYPLDVDWHTLAEADKAGKLLMITVRHTKRRLVGYALFVVGRRLHYRTSISAECDAFWLHPDLRRSGVGTQLMRYAESSLKSRGADVIINRCKLHGDLDFDPFFTGMGYTPIERVYMKRLD